MPGSLPCHHVMAVNIPTQRKGGGGGGEMGVSPRQEELATPFHPSKFENHKSPPQNTQAPPARSRRVCEPAYPCCRPHPGLPTNHTCYDSIALCPEARYLLMDNFAAYGPVVPATARA